MHFLDTIKNLEHARFSRKQAEAQVRAMTQTTNDLMTKMDGKQLENKMDYKFDLLAAEIRNLSKTTDIRFEAIYKELKYMHLKSGVFTVALLISVIALASHFPTLTKWFTP